MADDPFADYLTDLTTIAPRATTTLKDELWGDDWDALLQGDNTAPYSQYAGRPLDFAYEVLGVQEFSKDQIDMIQSVVDNTVTVAMSATAVGKTYLLAVMALYFYKCYRDVEIYAAAAPPSDNLRILLWGEISRFVSNRPELFTDDAMTDLKLSRGAKQHIRGLTIPTTGNDSDREAKFSGKHQKVLVFIFDEGDAIPDPCYRGADGCMSGGEIVRQIICFNPKKQTGEVYRRVRQRTAKVIQMSALNHPNVVSGTNRIKGAVTRNVTCKRINEWCGLVSSGEDEYDDDNLPVDVFKLPDYLVGYAAIGDDGSLYPPLQAGYYKIEDSQFAYKVLGRFPPAVDNALFPLDKIEEAVARYMEIHRDCDGVFPDYPLRRQGIDVAEKGSDDSVFCFRDGYLVHGFQNIRSMDSDEIADIGAERHVAHGVAVSFIDAIGVGSGVPGRMVRIGRGMAEGVNISAVGVKVSEASLRRRVEEGTFRRLRDELYWSFRQWLFSGKAAIPPNERLIYAMSIVTYEVAPDIVIMDKRTMRRILGFSPDEMESVLVTFANSRTSMTRI